MLKGFSHQVTEEEELRDMLGYPSELVVHKVLSHVDEHCQTFISQSPFVVVSTANLDGECDVSPRGDAAGFVIVLDEGRLAIPDRPGNRRLDSLRNILVNPYIGLLFLIPGLDETLRVNGRACIVRDENLLAHMEVNGKRPSCAIGVEVEEAYIHCAKAFRRSHLWQSDTWPAVNDLPNPAVILAHHAKRLNLKAEQVEQSLKESYTKRLY